MPLLSACLNLYELNRSYRDVMLSPSFVFISIRCPSSFNEFYDRNEDSPISSFSDVRGYSENRPTHIFPSLSSPHAIGCSSYLSDWDMTDDSKSIRSFWMRLICFAVFDMRFLILLMGVYLYIYLKNSSKALWMILNKSCSNRL